MSSDMKVFTVYHVRIEKKICHILGNNCNLSHCSVRSVFFDEARKKNQALIPTAPGQLGP